MHGQARGVAMVEGTKPGLMHGLAFGRDVNRACGIVADQNHGDARRDAVLGHEARSLRGHARPQLARECPAVDRSGVHPALPAGARRARTLESPSTSISFTREDAPETIRTLDFFTPTVRAINSTSALLAFPSSGAAATRALRSAFPAASLDQPSIASRPPFGVNLTQKRWQLGFCSSPRLTTKYRVQSSFEGK